MKEKQVTASTNVNGEERRVTFPLIVGDDVNEDIELYGEDIVHNYFVAKLVISAQDIPRSMMKQGKTDNEIIEAMKSWKPKLGRQKKSKVEVVEELLEKMTEEEKREFLKKYGLA